MKFVRLLLTSLFVLIAFSNVCFANTKDIEFTQAEKDFIQQQPVIRLGVDPQFIPYEFFDTDGQYKGIAADYIKLISERTGINLEVKQDITWAEAYGKAVEKKLDGLPCVTKTEEREQYFLYSEPYYTFQRVIIVKDSNNSVARLEDLFNKRVAVKKDGSHNSYLKTFSSIELSLYLTEEAAIEAVAVGKESYYVGNLATSSYFIKTNGLTNLKYIIINSEDKQYLHFAVRNDWPELVSIINKGLASITEEEKIAISNKWIGIEKKADYRSLIKIIVSVSIIIVIVFLISLFWIIKLKREVSEKIKVQEALKVAKEEAEVANRIKSTFLARMSHEIRTPLNAITGMAYLIKKTNITATQKIYLNKITYASRNMLGIINDILDFSKIEAGKIEIERISFNFDKVLQQVINIVSFRIEEQGIDFVVNKDPYLPVNYFGDPMRLEQILINIINNAIKFTTVGEVSVAVRLLTKEIDTYHIEFSVKDTGIGMSNEQLNNLFKPFDQGDSSINRRFGGTGLGLSIVKSLVDMLGGEIRVYSTPGEGSTFIIQLALEVDQKQEDDDEQKSASVYFENIRVLVLEKSMTYANLLKNYLNSFSIVAEFTASEDQTKQLLRNTINKDTKPYDLLIVDNDTPRVGGIDFVQSIKEDPLIEKKPKFILMIPLIREDLFEKIEAMDIDFGITKPILPSILYNGIIEIFKDKVLAMHDSASNAEQTLNLIVDYPYHVLIVEDNKTNQFIAKSILEQAGFIISLTDNGKMGFEFFEKHQQEIDLILMDLHMPILNGYETARLIRGLDSSMPIVAMTADAITGVVEQCKSVGIDYYISKPFEPEQLIISIWNVLKKERQQTKEKVTTKEIVIRDEDVLSETEGIRRLGSNKDLYLMVLDEYYRENQDVLTRLNSCIYERHYRDATQIVHKIKSSSGNIGAKRLFAIASELQKALGNEDETELIRLQGKFQVAFRQLFDEIARKISNPDI